ncbi:ThiF family adenylyltransferase [Bacillaceae bacterium IKA-2]|nr:ThiF family adenylyltransferase [Bacillaceae bacterium IKA-2]
MIKEQFNRNLGIMSEEDIIKLHETTISIAGCGCIGGFSAELLVRMGIGKLIIADPDLFDISNINRQCAATHHSVGMLKVEALKAHLLAINPDLEIVVYSKGVNEENVSDFVNEADYVIDAIDYFCLPEAVALHRGSRQKGLHIITAVALGFGASVLTFSPNGMKLEEYLGIPVDCVIDDLRGITFPASSYTSYLPSYATEEKITEWITNKTIPTISVGQALGPGALVSQMILHILGRKEPIMVPEKWQIQFE